MTASSTRRTTAATHPDCQRSVRSRSQAPCCSPAAVTRPRTRTRQQQRVTSTAPLADKLPKAIRDKGVIKVGSDIAYAPVEFKDSSGNTVGIDPDLAATRMGKQLGVKFEFENGTFDTLLTRSALQALRHRHVRDDRHQGPPGGHRRRDRQEGRRGRRLRRLLHRRRLDLHQEGRRPGHQDLVRPLRQEDRVQRGTVSTTWPRPSPRSARAARRSPSRPSTTTSRPRPGCAPAAPTPAPPTSRSPRTR